LNIKQEIVDKQGIADCLEGFARIASGQGNAERATRLDAAAQVLRQRIGVSPVRVERAEFERDVEAARVDAAWETVHDDAGRLSRTPWVPDLTYPPCVGTR
jgi:hypothetical protein